MNEKIKKLEEAKELLEKALPIVEEHGWEETFSSTYQALDWLKDNLEREKQDSPE